MLIKLLGVIALAIGSFFAGFFVKQEFPNCCDFFRSKSYYVGNSSYSADEIDSVEINWIGGKVKVIESYEKELTISEKFSDNSIKEEQKMHWYISRNEGGRGKLVVASSKPGSKVHSNDKELVLYIPKNLEKINICTVGTDNCYEDITANSVFASLTGGKLNLGLTSCKKVDFEGTGVSLGIKFLGKLGATITESGISSDVFGKKKRVIGDGECKIKVSGVGNSVDICEE